MPQSKGLRHKTRKVMRKHPRERGKLRLSRILRKYALGDRVVIKIDPAIHRGMPHRRYHGKVGVVVGMRGRAYIVEVPVGGETRTLIVRPEHLMPHGG